MKVSVSKLVLTLGLLAASASAQTLANYQATILSQSPSNYFKLDGSLESAVNGSVVLSSFAGGYGADVFGNASNAWFFANQSTAYLRYLSPLLAGGGASNTTSTAKGTISFLFRSLSGPNIGGQRSLFDATTVPVGTTNHNAFSLFFENDTATESPNALKLRFGDSTTTILEAANLLYSTWYYFAVTYDEARVPNKAIWYVAPVGGTLSTGMTTNSPESVAGDGTGLYIGQRADITGAYRSPGSGRVDEFAIWAGELTPLDISNQFTKLPAPPSGVLVTNVIVNDSFADGSRTNTGPLQADWWSSSATNGNSVEAYTNQLGLISGTSGRGLHGTFAPQTLAIGDTIRATFTFTTPATVGAGSASTAFKIAMMDFNDAGLAADLSSASATVNPLYTNLPGYMIDLDVNDAVASDISIRKHLVNTSGRFLGTTAEWFSFGSSADAGYVFAPNTEYVGVISITRTEADGVDIFGSMSQGGTLMDSYTDSDSSGIANHFGMIGFWANTSAFGSSTTAGELVDNGITFSNIKIEVVTYSTPTPTLNIAHSGNNVLLSWPASTPSSYVLEATNVLNSATIQATNWPNAGTPSIVGTNYVVTNAVSADARFYRLHKP